MAKRSGMLWALTTVCVMALAVQFGVAHAQDADAQAQHADGYAGVVAPSKPSDKGPAGYAGVVSGYVAPAPEKAESEAEQEIAPVATKKRHKNAVVEDDAEEVVTGGSSKVGGFVKDGNSFIRPVERISKGEDVTKIPGTNMPRRAISVAQLNAMALAYKFDKDGNGVFDEVEKNQREFSPAVVALLSKPSKRIDGMLPLEWDAKDTIESYTPGIVSEKMSAAEKKEYIKGAYKELDEMATGVRYKLAVPADMQKKMGLPDIYIKEGHDDAEKALKRLEAALIQLEKMM